MILQESGCTDGGVGLFLKGIRDAGIISGPAHTLLMAIPVTINMNLRACSRCKGRIVGREGGWEGGMLI